MSEEWKQIEAVLDEKVRPSLRAHGGELEIDHLEDGVLYIKLLGQCAGCPSADLTNETLIEHELTAALPELVQKVVVVQTVSDELWEQAKRLLRDHLDRLLAAGRRRALEVQRARRRDYENVKRAALALRDQRFEDRLRVLPERVGDGNRVDARVGRIEMRLIGDFRLIQNTHDICFFSFACHKCVFLVVDRVKRGCGR